MKRLFFSAWILWMVCCAGCLSAVTDNRWTFYASCHDFTYNRVVDGTVYSVSSGAVVTYTPSTSEISLYNKTSGFSDVRIRFMEYSAAENCMMLVYENANIDLWYIKKEGVTNLPQFKNSTSLSDHTINDITINGRYAYVAQASGVTVVNMQKGEFTNTYTLGRKVNSALRLGNNIYAFTDNGIYVGNTALNLLDAHNWTLLSAQVCKLGRAFGQRIYAIGTAGLYDLGTDGSTSTLLDAGNFTWINAGTSTLFYGGNGKTGRLATTGTVQTLTGGDDIQWMSEPDGGICWAACGQAGLIPYKLENGQLTRTGSSILPNSPLYNYCDNMYVAPSGKLWVGGGSMNYQGLNYEATLYSFDGKNFVNYPDTLQRLTGLDNYRNITGVAEDPTDASHIFATTAETGLYEFQNGKFTAHYDYEENGGHLYSAAPGYGQASRSYVRTGGPAFDEEGNLWMLNFEVDTIVQIRKKDGTWRGIYLPSIAKWPTFDHILLDGKGRAWITHRRTTSVHHASVICLDYGGTIDDTSDDRSQVRYNFTNQDGETTRPTLVNDVCMDKEGQIWVATNEGPFVISNPDEFMNSDFTFTQVKVPRNDGTNYADYLLAGIPVTSIAVDEAGRKWLATSGNGVYFLSADNMTQLGHFTTENSPLISNNILSVAVMDKEGLVMIGTSEGLMSYRYDKATTESDFKDDNLKVYPNPVRPGYEGNITISGLTEGAEVKIVSTGGQTVAAGTSAGGKFVWNGTDHNGRRVATGVYYVLCSTASGSKSAGTRIVFIR